MRVRFAFLFIALLSCLWGCEGMLQEKELDQGKVDRAMDQAEKGE